MRIIVVANRYHICTHVLMVQVLSLNNKNRVFHYIGPLPILRLLFMVERLCLNLNEITDPVVSDIVGCSLPTRLMFVQAQVPKLGREFVHLFCLVIAYTGE